MSWRKFQSAYLLKTRRREKTARKVKAAVLGLVLVLAVAAAGLLLLPMAKQFWSQPDLPAAPGEPAAAAKPAEPAQLTKAEVAPMINPVELSRSDKNIFFVDTPENSYKVTTSIDIYLQEYLLAVLGRLKKQNRGKPQRIAFVVMEADTGKIIAMTGFDLGNSDTNPCMAADYPAASIFKIITASAAVEKLGYKPGTPLFFNGSKYTLYKRQLRDVKNKYTSRITFSSAFAESINPVFGKLGKNRLGREALDAYARAFGFNEQINSELPVFTGNFKTTESEYHLAELGCGFNTDTTISPVFGAMLTSAIINSGRLMAPSIVEHVTDADGKVIYKNKKATYKTPINPETASTMVALMEKTVTRGTARKSFRGFTRDKILSQLVIGGKTGSLYNREHTVKYDWFTGFGKEKKTSRKIALSIVVGHRKYIGTRASTYAKMILKEYFKTRRSLQAGNTQPGGGEKESKTQS